MQKASRNSFRIVLVTRNETYQKINVYRSLTEKP